MNRSGAFAVDPRAVHRKKHPDAIEFKPAICADARFGDADGVETFDGMQANVRQPRGRRGAGHEKSLTDWCVSRAPSIVCRQTSRRRTNRWGADNFGELAC